MEIVFISKLKPLLDAVAGDMDLYVPAKSGEHYIYNRYDAEREAEFNNIRACTPVKEFLFPVREMASTYPKAAEEPQIKPFAVFGLKQCDLQSIKILDKVFYEEDLKDPFYIARRENMFIISSDCFEPGESCFCNILGLEGSCNDGFDLNVSAVKGGFVVQAGSDKGKAFIDKHSQIFTDAPSELLSERDKNRAETKEQLEKNNSELEINGSLKEAVLNNQDSDVYDIEAKKCVECQACTRVCPTCHCFYLYDTKQKDYFAKMKMWDSCMRLSYAAVAGGENPNKILGDRLKHRILHKFVYFLDRYGLEMCVGCGRCVDADAGGIDLRQILKKLSEEPKDKNPEQVKVAK